MANHFREPNRRQQYLLPVDMLQWVGEDDIVHLILDVVEAMDLERLEQRYQVGGVGAPAYAPRMMLAVLIYAYTHGYTSSRKIERLCVRDAGFRMIVGEETPDHASIARFRRRHIDDIQSLFTAVLALCRKAGLGRLGLVALDGTKVKGNAALEANRTTQTLEEEVRTLLRQAEADDVREEALYGDRRGDDLPKGLRHRAERLKRLQQCREQLEREAVVAAQKQQEQLAVGAAEEQATGKKRRGRKPKTQRPAVDADAKANPTDPDSRIMKTRTGWVQGYNGQIVVTPDQIILAAAVTQDHNDVQQLDPMLTQTRANADATGEAGAALGIVLADAGYWSDANAGVVPPDSELLIATRKDWKQRRALKIQRAPRGRIPAALSSRGRMERKLLTRRGKALYKLRGQTVEPVFGQMKQTQNAGQFRLRGLRACDGEWKLHAAAHNLKKLHGARLRQRAPKRKSA
jgi:transposase